MVGGGGRGWWVSWGLGLYWVVGVRRVGEVGSGMGQC